MSQNKEPKPNTKRPTPPPTPPRPKPWDPTPFPSSCDPTEDTTYTAIGRALSAWEGLEGSVANLFAVIVGGGADPLPASRAYGAVLTFKGRAEMVKAAADAYFFEHHNATLEAEIAEIMNHAIGFSGRRNEIAHGIVRSVYADPEVIGSLAGPVRWQHKNLGFAIQPPDYATNKTKLESGSILTGVARQPKYTYGSAEIITFTNKFIALSRRIDSAQWKILSDATARHCRTSP